MNDRDTDTFARFTRRFAAIEAHVGDPPRVVVGRQTPPGLRHGLSRLAVLGVFGVVVAVAALGPLVAGPSAPGPTAKPTLAGASTGSPSPTSTTTPTLVPAGAAEPTVIWCRLTIQSCTTAIDLVREGHPGEVAAAWAIVVADVCPPTVVCDRLYPFMSAVVLVPPPGGSVDPRPFLVVGKDYRPERVDENGIGPIPEHIAAMIRTLSTSPRVAVGGWPASCVDVEVGVCRGVAGLVINNLGRSRPAGGLLIQNRLACPATPTWADRSHCWQADVPVMTGIVCMVIAIRTMDRQYAQVAGDVPGKARLPTDPVGCPPDN